MTSSRKRNQLKEQKTKSLLVLGWDGHLLIVGVPEIHIIVTAKDTITVIGHINVKFALNALPTKVCL